MFSYLRIFAVASLLAVSVIAVVVGMYFREQAGGSMQALAERENAALVRQFSANLWPKPHTTAPIASITQELQSDIERFVQETHIPALRLYSPDGILLYTTDGALSASLLLPMAESAAAAPKRMRSSIATAAESGLSGAAPAVLLRSVAVLGDPPQAYLEIYSDIGAPWQRLAVLQWIASGTVVLVVFVMIWVLILTSRKAEAIIARQHEANLELAAAAANAQAENRDKSQFLANISHELRTPLNAIIGFSEIIRNDMEGKVVDRTYQGYVQDIFNSGVHLLSLINDILDFSKAEAGKLELEIEEVNASKTVTTCLRLVTPRAEVGNVEMINAIPKESYVLETDGKKFKQIMLNLLSNAVKFTPSGGRVRIRAWRDTDADMYVFEISDTGIGIAPKDIARAMSPFGQVDNALSRRYEGTGLGLPLTKKFVELMGGKFTIHSQQNVGTTVTFSLPRLFKPREDVIVKRIS